MFFSAIGDTLKTLGTPYFLRMLAISVAVTAAIFAMFAFGTGTLVAVMKLSANPWHETLFGIIAGTGAMILAWFLFPVVVPLIGVVFLENIATHIEKREYGLGDIRALPFGGEVMHALRFGLFALLLNLCLLPVYIILAFTVVLGPALYYCVNGYLMGREFFELAGARHIGRPEARRLRKRYGTNVFFCGVAIVLMGTLPLLNLFAPFIGAALAVHLFRRTAGREGLMIASPTAIVTMNS